IFPIMQAIIRAYPPDAFFKGGQTLQLALQGRCHLAAHCLLSVINGHVTQRYQRSAGSDQPQVLGAKTEIGAKDTQKPVSTVFCLVERSSLNPALHLKAVAESLHRRGKTGTGERHGVTVLPLANGANTGKLDEPGSSRIPRHKLAPGEAAIHYRLATR